MRLYSGRRAATIGIIAVAFVAVVALSAAWFINSRLLPQITVRLERYLEEACGCEASIGAVGWGPVRGLFLEDLSLASTAGYQPEPDNGAAPGSLSKPGRLPASVAVSIAAERIDIDADLGTLRRLEQVARGRRSLPDRGPGTGDPGVGDPGPGGSAEAPSRAAVDAVLRRLSGLAAAGLIPERIGARDVTVTVAPGVGGKPYLFRFESVGAEHDALGGLLAVTSVASPDSKLHAGLLADYAEREMALSLALHRVEIPGIVRQSLSTAAALLSTSLDVRLPSSGSVLLSGSLDVEQFAVEAPVIAPGTIGPVSLSVAFAAEYDPFAPDPAIPATVPYSIRRHFPRGVFSLNEGTVRINGVELSVGAVLTGVRTDAPHPVTQAPAGMPRRINLELGLERTPVSRINQAIPAALKGPLETVQVDGDFTWRLNLDFPRYNPLGLQWTAEPELERFSVRGIARELNPFGLNGAFVHTIRDPELGYTRHVLIPPADPQAEAAVPPGSPSPDPSYVYRRLEEISPMVIASVIIAEDGAFYFHDGVNFRTLAHAVVRNLSAGEVQVGASTITMQLAKMLFLSDERVFSRKLQEVFLVYLMEHEVPVAKDRILEIYLNIAEFGPGVFGIHDAAQYYFAEDASELDVGQATFLASILPSPKRYHWYFAQGEISDGWFIRMKSYYDIMLRRGHLSPEEYQQALERKPAFAGRPDPGAQKRQGEDENESIAG